MKILEGQNELGVKIPFITLTNGGGVIEDTRAKELSTQLNTNIKTSQVIQAHTIIKSLVPKYRGKAVLVLGGIGDSVRRVAESYGLDAYTPLDILAWESTSVNITHIRESGTYLILYLSYNRISPFHTLTKEEQSTTRPGNFSTTPIHAVIVFHDPRNWLLDTQVVCDVLQGRYVEPSLWEKMKKANPSPVDLIFCNPDLIWRAAFPQPRLGQGGFITAFQAVYQAQFGEAYPFTQYGKPCKDTYDWAKIVLKNQIAEMERTDPNHIETPPIYMIGDNPASDIAGANGAGWGSILVHTGVYDPTTGIPPAHTPTHQAEDVAQAVHWALKREAGKLATSTQQGGFPMQLVFKCENLQKVGAFKFRGATNAILQILRSHTELDPSSLTVVTHSSGNHAQALAYAARSVGARACIVMPSNATPAKIDAVRGYGAAVTLCEPILSAREETMYRVIEEEKLSRPEQLIEIVPPYDDPRIISGQGTMAVEFLEQAEQIGRPLDVIITPVGGGGMLSGCSLAATGLKPGIKVVGAEPAGSGDAYESFKTKTWVPSVNPQTFCDGLLTSTGKLTFPIILDHVDAICMATEEQIARAMKFVWERMKLVIEPSAAVPLAVVFYSPEFHEAAARWSADKQAGLNIGIVISGGNVNMQAALNIINSAKMDQSPVAVATKWFEAYSAGNFEAMKSLAADGYTFEDPAFGKLEADRALGMYKMFTSTRDKTEAVWNVHEVKPSESDPQRAIVQFEAIYKFNGRPVTNQITSNILVVDGKVKEQVDSFDVPKWAGETPVLSGGNHW
ncbi:Pyridoxal-phosphate dependent enzyme, partial [Rhizoctonia solani]